MTGPTFLPGCNPAMGQGHRVLSCGDICPKTLILLDDAYFMAFLTDNIPVLPLLYIYERFLNRMAGSAKVRIILCILIISITIKKKGKDYDRQYETFNIVGDRHPDLLYSSRLDISIKLK
jgi:hypothetical protein